MDVIGRKTCIVFMFIPLIISWALISVASSYEMLLIAMIISSTALGLEPSLDFLFKLKMPILAIP